MWGRDSEVAPNEKPTQKNAINFFYIRWESAVLFLGRLVSWIRGEVTLLPKSHVFGLMFSKGDRAWVFSEVFFNVKEVSTNFLQDLRDFTGRL